MVNKTDIWDSVDWTKTNTQIAQELSRAYSTVAKRRMMLGKSGMANHRETRKDKGMSIPQSHLANPAYQKLATQMAKLSPKAGRFETNSKAKTWVLKSPNNVTYTITNLMHFVRQNPHLFDPVDVIWQKKKNGVEWCRASNGLALLNSKGRNAPQSWKGWKLIK